MAKLSPEAVQAIAVAGAAASYGGGLPLGRLFPRQADPNPDTRAGRARMDSDTFNTRRDWDRRIFKNPLRKPPAERTKSPQELARIKAAEERREKRRRKRLGLPDEDDETPTDQQDR